MKLLLLAFISAYALSGFSQLPAIQWQAGLVGSQIDLATSIQQTSDGGYISLGEASSTDGDFTTSHGSGDGWIAKFNAAGLLQWKSIIGGSSLDNLFSVIQTGDGGYLALGRTYSDDGDVSGFHTSINTTDCWIVKLNSLGVIQWQRALGGTGSDEGRYILETANGYIIAGSSSSHDGDVSANHGTGINHDYWVVNLDAGGSIIWEKTYGGSGDDMAFSIEKTTDGSFLVAGMSNSANGDITTHNGAANNYNCWIIKINATGSIKWDKSFLISSYTCPSSVKETVDKGFIICGRSGLMGSLSSFDALLIKVDSIGTLQWQKSYGGTLQDDFYAILETGNSGYMAAGTTYSNNGDISHYLGGSSDCWLVQVDVSGNIIQEKTYGGTNEDGFAAFQKTNDNSYIAAGYSASMDADVTTNQDNLSDNVWIVKFKPLDVGIDESQSTNQLSLYPNPASDVITVQSPDHSTTSSYTLINALGQIMLGGVLEETHTVIDIHTLARGFYTLQIGNKQKQSYKIIKN